MDGEKRALESDETGSRIKSPNRLVRTPARSLIQAIVLGAVLAVAWAAQKYASDPNANAELIAAVGLLLLAGTLAGELSELIRLPQLTGFLVMGVLVGPYVGLVSQPTVARLSFVNTLALSLIALAGGAELDFEQMKNSLRTLAWATIFQSALGLVLSATAFAALARFIPFTAGLGTAGLIGVALLWGAFAVSRSPSATLAVLSQTRAAGPITRFSLAFVMSSDVVVVVLLTTLMMFVQPLLKPGIELSISSLADLAHELVSSVAVGTTLGLLIAAYLRIIAKHLLLVLLAMAYGLTEAFTYLRFDPLLTFLIAGFVVRNLSSQGPKLLEGIERTGTVAYVVFFATAGVALDIPLLRTLWPIAIALCAVRAVASWVAHDLSGRVARDEPRVRRYGWTSLFSQAGLTLGLAGVVENAFPNFGREFRSLVIATVAINQVFGPVLFKLALDRSGESGAGGLAHETA